MYFRMFHPHLLHPLCANLSEHVIIPMLGHTTYLKKVLEWASAVPLPIQSVLRAGSSGILEMTPKDSMLKYLLHARNLEKTMAMDLYQPRRS